MNRQPEPEKVQLWRAHMPESENALWAKTRRRAGEPAANRAERERRRKGAQSAAFRARRAQKGAPRRAFSERSSQICDLK